MTRLHVGTSIPSSKMDVVIIILICFSRNLVKLFIKNVKSYSKFIWIVLYGNGDIRLLLKNFILLVLGNSIRKCRLTRIVGTHYDSWD